MCSKWHGKNFPPNQLEFVAKISNLHYVEAFQCIGNPIHWNASIYWVTNTLKCFNILGYQYIEMLQYIANFLFLQRTLTVNRNQSRSKATHRAKENDIRRRWRKRRRQRTTAVGRGRGRNFNRPLGIQDIFPIYVKSGDTYNYIYVIETMSFRCQI